MKSVRMCVSISLFCVFVLSTPLLILADSGPDHQTLSRPLRLGTSGGNIYDRSNAWCCSGTLGALVTGSDGKAYILSNNHVLARTNAASEGDPIIQPGLIDESPACAQDDSDTVASLTSWVPISFKRGTSNFVDAAIAEVAPGVSVDGRIVDIPSVGLAERGTLNATVKKSGRTTGLTTGTIAAVNVSISVKYGSTCGGGRGTGAFRDQIRITPASFSAGGDSGSLIVTTGGKPVGLLFAGSSTSTFANQIDQVLSAFDITINQYAAAGSWGTWFAGLLPRPTAAHAASAGGPPVSRASEAAATHAKARHERALMAIPGVVGVGVGVSDSAPGQAAVEVYVEHDSPRLRASIPAHVDNVPVKVVETGEIVARVSCRHDRR